MEAGNLESPMKLVDIANGTAENGHNVLSHRILSSRLRNNALEIVTHLRSNHTKASNVRHQHTTLLFFCTITDNALPRCRRFCCLSASE